MSIASTVHDRNDSVSYSSAGLYDLMLEELIEPQASSTSVKPDDQDTPYPQWNDFQQSKSSVMTQFWTSDSGSKNTIVYDLG